MHQYIETVRTEIESASGQESYLTSALFMRIHEALDYEDGGLTKLETKDAFEKVQNLAIGSLGKNEPLNQRKEVLAWQAAILRDIARDFHGWWSEYKEQRFMAPDMFDDGEPCVKLEATATRLKKSPTEIFAKVLEIEQVLVHLASSPNQLIIEMDRYWQFKATNLLNSPENAFVNKRIQTERNNSLLAQSAKLIDSMAQDGFDYASQLSGGYHLLWVQPAIMLKSLSLILNGFLDVDSIYQGELILNQWVENLFPSRLEDGTPNPACESPLHHRIIANLAQASQCMVQYQVHGNDAFAQRDAIIRPHIVDMLETIKLKSLRLMNSSKQSEREEAQK